MTELNTPVAPSSEQPAVPVAEPSQQGQVAESSPAPAAESKPETPAIDIDALRKQVAEEAAAKARHDTESEWGKKLSESRRQSQERARQEREQLLTSLSDFVPDTQLAALREQHTARQKQQEQAEEVEQVKARLAQYEQSQAYAEMARKATIRAEKAGYNVSELPPDVRGDSPVGFDDRFTDFLAEEVGKLRKKVTSETKKAAEDAARETERKLGVTTVTGSSPMGKGGDTVDDLKRQIGDAASRGDKEKLSELRDAIYREVGIGR